VSKTGLLQTVRAAGLDEKEAELYLAGLRLGAAPAAAYAAATGFNRVTAYNYLEALTRRAIFTVERLSRGRQYAPVQPDALALEARKNADAFHRALPELRSMQRGAHRQPHVRFYAGWEGVRRVYEDTLTAGSDILNFANSATIRRFWPTYDEEYVAERVKRKIQLRGIAPDDEAGRAVHGQDRKTLREIRLVPAHDFDFNNEISIYDDKVAISSFGETEADLFGVIIESREVAETQRQIFAMAWRYAGKQRKR